MILSCPSCGARFKIDPGQLGGGGRTVRCSKCRHTWHAQPEGEAPEAAVSAPAAAAAPVSDAPADNGGGSERAPAMSDTSTASDDNVTAFESSLRATRYTSYAAAPPPEERKSGRGALVGWLLLVLVVGGLVAGLWYFREQVVAQVPQAARAYRMAGVNVPALGVGLELRDVTRTRRLVDGESLLVIEGRVINTGDTERKVPRLRVVLFDAAGDELLAWTFAAAENTLPPGGETGFSTQREDPPETAREFALSFASADAE